MTSYHNLAAKLSNVSVKVALHPEPPRLHVIDSSLDLVADPRHTVAEGRILGVRNWIWAAFLSMQSGNANSNSERGDH